MLDPGRAPLSTSEGRKPSSTAADRLMVGLAAIALLGGALIAISRLLPAQPDQTAQTSATPAASRHAPSPTPRPTPVLPPPDTMELAAVGLPSFSPPRRYFDGWIRVNRKVAVVSATTRSAFLIGMLHAGDAAHVSALPPGEGGAEGWLRVNAPEEGWLHLDIGDRDVHAFEYRHLPYADLTRLVAGPDRFLANSWNDADRGLTLVSSTDGAVWEPSRPVPYLWDPIRAYGPAGWLMVGALDIPDRGSVVYEWRSADGVSWRLAGNLPQTADSGVQWFAGSDQGYVLVTGYGGSRRAWYSADGLVWTERPMPPALDTDANARIAATPIGYFLWAVDYASRSTQGAFSADGWDWYESDLDGVGPILDALADGDRLLALARGSTTVTLLAADVSGGRLVWTTEATPWSEDDAVVRLISDGSRLIALGWDRESQAPLWWEREGTTWQRHEMPPQYGGVPREAAGGAQGIVVVGWRENGARATPIVWRLAGQTWYPEVDPLIPPPDQPDARECGSVPDDLLQLLSMDGSLAATCFNDARITVRGFTHDCHGCYRRATGRYRTAWLASPVDHDMVHLSPITSTDWGTVEAVLHPSADHDLPMGRWVEVTGHYDDRAARSCRAWPAPANEYWFTGPYDVVLGCRSWFVITDWHVVHGPA